MHHEQVRIGALSLEGELTLPSVAGGLVLFAHGSGSSRHSPRNRQAAQVLQQRGLGTLLFDLLTEEEAVRRERVFDIGLLAARLVEAIDDCLARVPPLNPALGLFGASTGAAAALVAAARRPREVHAVVSRGGRPDLAADLLAQVQAPTLLIVGGADTEVLALNRGAHAQLRCEKALEIIPGATHLFEEPGTLETAAELAADWFRDHLVPLDAAGSD